MPNSSQDHYQPAESDPAAAVNPISPAASVTAAAAAPNPSTSSLDASSSSSSLAAVSSSSNQPAPPEVIDTYEVIRDPAEEQRVDVSVVIIDDPTAAVEIIQLTPPAIEKDSENAVSQMLKSAMLNENDLAVRTPLLEQSDVSMVPEVGSPLSGSRTRSYSDSATRSYSPLSADERKMNVLSNASFPRSSAQQESIVVQSMVIASMDAPMAPPLSIDLYSATKPLMNRPAPTFTGDYDVKPNDWRAKYADDIVASDALGSEYNLIDPAANANLASVTLDNGTDSELSTSVSSTAVRSGSASGLLDKNVARNLATRYQKQQRRPIPAVRSHSAYHFSNFAKSSSPPEEPVIPRPPKKFSCGICLEEQFEEHRVVFGQQRTLSGDLVISRAKNVQCVHAYCKECLFAYLKHEIEDGRVLKIKCPEVGCQCVAPSSWIKTIVTPMLYDKYQRFVQMKSDGSFRSCPNMMCMHVQQRSDSDQMKCEKCATEYCYLHDLAHAAGANHCKDYRKKLNEESKDSIQHIAESTVRCPWPLCRVQCIKASGCNHMTCNCGTEFCYLCGGFYFGGLHFAPCNIFGCPNMKSTDLPANCRNTWFRFILRGIFGTPFLLLALALGIAVFGIALGFWLAWFFVLSPIWLVWGSKLAADVYCKDEDRYDESRRFWKCVGWFPYVAYKMLS